MSINILKKSAIESSEDSVGLPCKNLSRDELRKIAGLSNGSISIPSLTYISFTVNLITPFYCRSFSAETSTGTSIAYAYLQRDQYARLDPVPIDKANGTFSLNFNQILPDHAQLIYKFKFTLINLDASSMELYSTALWTVNYPIDFDYTSFSLVASSQGNFPIKIYNKSVQRLPQDIRILPMFSNDYEADAVYTVTSGGKNDPDKYSIHKGYRIPEDAPWTSGRISEQSAGVPSLRLDGRSLTLSGTVTSGTWTSPVLYLADPDMISMYVYADGVDDDAYINKDFQTVDSLVEVRGGDSSPLPNFLISNWTQRLYTYTGRQSSLSLPSRRPGYLDYQSVPSPTASFWAPYPKVQECGPPGQNVGFRPFIVGRSKRMYVKGDGTVLAQAPIENDSETFWEYGHRGTNIGIPYREFGDINSFWNVGHLTSLLGQWAPNKSNYTCGLPYMSAPSLWHRMTFASESDSSDWAKGRDVSGKLKLVYPYYWHYEEYNFGISNEPIYCEPLGSFTMAVDSHPNEWVSLSSIMYPWGSSNKFMSIYYTHLRNFWVSETKLIGSYGIGQVPADEGWAVCKAQSDNGFWLHVGYNVRIIDRYDMNGDKVASTRVNYGFNALRETTDPLGLWALRNDRIYWYRSDSEGNLTEEFSIYNSTFKYLQMGDVDASNNLWIIDRDTSTIFRVNFSSRSIDYQKEIAFVVGIWPHPRDGTAYVYKSFDASTFSTAIGQIDVSDPYGYVETLTVLPEIPLSDSSGVQFQGRVLQSYLNPSINDPVWGTDDDLTLDWQTYPNASLNLPAGKYKQFRITLNRTSPAGDAPVLRKIRVPKSLVLKQIPYDSYGNVYINPHLRYSKKYGKFNTELVVWWPH